VIVFVAILFVQCFSIVYPIIEHENTLVIVSRKADLDGL